MDIMKSTFYPNQKQQIFGTNNVYMGDEWIN